MALTGKLSTNTDKKVRGGIKQFWLAPVIDFETGSTIALTARAYTTWTHLTSVFTNFKGEEFRMSYTSSGEGAGRGQTITYEFQAFFPQGLEATSTAVQSMIDEGKLLLIIEDWNGTKRIFGYDETLNFDAAGHVTNVEDASGAAASEGDQHGQNVTIAFRQLEVAHIFNTTVPV